MWAALPSSGRLCTPVVGLKLTRARDGFVSVLVLRDALHWPKIFDIAVYDAPRVSSSG